MLQTFISYFDLQISTACKNLSFFYDILFNHYKAKIKRDTSIAYQGKLSNENCRKIWGKVNTEVLRGSSVNLDSNSAIIIMGCVPAEKRQTVAAASIAVKKTPSLKQIDSKSKSSSNSQDNNHLRGQEQIAYFSQKQSPKKDASIATSPRIQKQTSEPNHTFVYTRNSPASRQGERDIVRILPPVARAPQGTQKEDLSKLASINTLDIHSRIKLPQEKAVPKSPKVLQQRQAQWREEDINITFNNNNFGVHSSAAKSIGMGKRWRQQTLRQQLRGMNQQNFRKIAVQCMPFN